MADDDRQTDSPSSCSHQFVYSKRMQAELGKQCYAGKWAPKRGIVEENDRIIQDNTMILPGRVLVNVPCIESTLVLLPPRPGGSNIEHSTESTPSPESNPSSKRYDTTTITVANIDTITAALTLGGNVCALNFANADTPGGRYRHNGRAQEEDLCRVCPQLYPSLKESKAYPLPPNGVLVTARVRVLRQIGTYELSNSLGEVAILSGAMPCGIADRRPKGGWLSASSQWREIVTERIRAVLYAASSCGYDTIILGAYGCGAFGNPARPVAILFRELLKSDEFRGCFSQVVFAVLDPLGTGNLGPFRQELGADADWR